MVDAELCERCGEPIPVKTGPYCMYCEIVIEDDSDSADETDDGIGDDDG